MSKFLALLKSKKFWTLVTAIVAALSAFFLTSCVSSGSVFRRGVHHDTVEYQFKIRSRNFQTFAQCQTKPSTNFQCHSILTFGQSIPASGIFTATVTTTNSLAIQFAGSSFSRINLMPDLPRIYESFKHHEVNFCSRVEEELFDGPEWPIGRVLISCYIPHLWGKMFDCLRTDRVSEAVSPSRRPKRPSQRHKNSSPRR